MPHKLATKKWSELGCRALPNYADPLAHMYHTGLELEVENPNLPEDRLGRLLRTLPGNVWQTRREGSLRDGFEVATAEPLNKTAAMLSLYSAKYLFEGAVDTFRAAVHVHVNVQPLTALQIIRAGVVYALMEEEFYSYAGKGRDESPFCKPWYSCSTAFEGLYKAYCVAEQPREFGVELAAFPKYAGLNLQAVYNYGSIEFRHLQTPVRAKYLTTVRVITKYMEMCYRVITLATEAPDRLGCGEAFVDYVLNALEYADLPTKARWLYPVLKTEAKVDPLTDGVPLTEVKNVVPLPPQARRYRVPQGLEDILPMRGGV